MKVLGLDTDRRSCYHSRDTNNNLGEYLPNFTLQTETLSCRGQNWLLVFRLFFGELVASAMVTFPYFLIDPTLRYCAVSEALAVGGLVYAAVWVTYPLSGAQINPIITLAFGLTRRICFFFVPVYWIAQFLGAGFAMSIAYYISPFVKLSPDMGMTMPRSGITAFQALWLECLITFLLLVVILAGTDEARETVWTMGSGSTLACVYMLMYLVTTIVTKNLTGASMNPFRSIVAAILRVRFEHQWIYAVGPLVGCLIAVVFNEVVLTEDACWIRTKAWLTDMHYFRNHSYSLSGRPSKASTQAAEEVRRFSTHTKAHKA
ncbi:Aquaporin-4 [Echinococcus granulosus]|nr:Aquaporin-4 [Echinococcus granulosus]